MPWFQLWDSSYPEGGGGGGVEITASVSRCGMGPAQCFTGPVILGVAQAGSQVFLCFYGSLLFLANDTGFPCTEGIQSLL